MVITLFLILKTGTQNWTPYYLIQLFKFDAAKIYYFLIRTGFL